MRRIIFFAVILVVIALSTGIDQRAQAQQAGGIAFEFPEICNYVALAAGVVADVEAQRRPGGTCVMQTARPSCLAPLA